MPRYSVAIIGSSGGGSATMSSGEATILGIREHLRVIEDPNHNPETVSNQEIASQSDQQYEGQKIKKSKSSRRSSIEYESMYKFLLAGPRRLSSHHFSQSTTKTPDETATTSKYQVDVAACCFTVCECGLDFTAEILSEVSSELWVIKSSNFSCVSAGVLKDTNILAEKEDAQIANLIRKGEIHGLIVISCDVVLINRESIQAAIDMNIPIVGTGGTCISYISTHGGNVIGSSGGSVSTTNTSKSVCFAAALASYWSLDYHPPIQLKGISFQTVAGATLPIFVAMTILKIFIRLLLKYSEEWAIQFPGECVAQAILQQYSPAATLDSSQPMRISTPKVSKRILSKLSKLFEKVIKGVSQVPSKLSSSGKVTTPLCSASYYGHLVGVIVSWSSRVLLAIETRALPLVVCTVTAAEVSGLAELSMLAGSAAGSLVSDSILAGYVAGAVCGVLLPWLLLFCARKSVLPTASTIAAVGLSAVIGGSVGAGWTPWLASLTEWIRNNLWLVPTLIVKFVNNGIQGTLAPDSSMAAVDSFLSDVMPFLKLFFGGMMGWLVSWGSEHGYYHLLILPLILLEMEKADLSLLGAYDMVCLCAPSAGVCLAVWLLSSYYDQQQQCVPTRDGSWDVNHKSADHDRPRSRSHKTPSGFRHHLSLSSAAIQESSTLSPSDTHNSTDLPSTEVKDASDEPTNTIKPFNIQAQHSTKSIATKDKETFNKKFRVHKRVGKRGFLSAFLMGDFVEACYPYTLHNPPLLLSIRLCSFLSGMVISNFKIRSSAYLPIPFSIICTYMDSDVGNFKYLVLVVCLNFFIPFLVSLYLLKNSFD